MLNCSLCNTPNYHLAIVCSNCGSFLQRRVENLDLFTTMWSLIERPVGGFRTIALARHKNYALTLSAVGGIGLAFLFFWALKAGEFAENMLNLIVAGTLTGPLVGVVIVGLLSLFVRGIANMSRAKVRLRDVFSVVAYALLPVVFTLFLVLPIELLTFGQFFFTRNPSPFLLKPFSYIVLIGLDGASVLWSLVLLCIGITVLLEGRWFRALSIVFLSLFLVAGISEVLRRVLLPQL